MSKTPRPEEFKRFDELLTEHAPDGYTPWYFRCEAGSKAPALDYGSWKDESARLTAGEAVEWMENGGNVGIAGTADDALVNVDIDDEDETTPSDLKETLVARSRSRTGVHAWYFEAPDGDIPNIPTDDAGEVRANWQYVVAPGSYVDTDPSEVPDGHQDDAGYYTVEWENPVTSLRFKELPEVFRQHKKETEQEDAEPDLEHDLPAEGGSSGDGSRKSALFDIGARDVVRKEGGTTDTDERWSSLFHGSGTDANMSVSDQGLIQCWRHNVAHNGLQALVVLSDYSGGCEAVGAGHRGSNAGASCITQEDGAHVWHAWKYAKQNSYIPDGDPVPYSAIRHLCRARNLCAVTEIPDEHGDGSIPGHAYDAALKTIENSDGLNPGRKETSEINDSEKDTFPKDTPDQEPDKARSDGGATAATASGSDAPSRAKDWFLDPLNVLELAVQDPLHPLDYDDDGAFDGSIRDLRTAERANYVWELAKKCDEDNILAQHKGPIYAYEDGVWRDDDSQRMRQIAGRALDIGFSKSVVGELEEQIRKDRMKRPEELGAPDATIMCDNGLLDLTDRSLEEAKPSHHALAKIPTEYDPDAECPRWEQFVEESVETAPERKKLQEYAGYTLWRHAQDFGKAMFLVGPTDSGKGTTLKAIKQVLGRENVAAESLHDLIQTRWGTAQLYGNIANIRNEVTPSGLGQVQKFKELTGGEDEINAEFKGQDKFEFLVTQKFLFSTNEVPTVENADEAFYNRLLFVRFPNTVAPSDQDKQLLDKLADEDSGILNWMLEGLDRLLGQGQFTGERSTTGKKEICDAFGGVIDRFTHNCLMVTGNSEDAVSKSDLHSLAKAYADDIDKEPEWNKQTGFTQQIGNQRGISQGQKRINGDPTKVFVGVRVKPEVVYRYDMEMKATTDPDAGSKAQGLDNFQDDDVRPGYDSTEELNVLPRIVQAVRGYDDPEGMPHEELVAELEGLGVAQSRAEAKIDKALEQGRIHEPLADTYRV